MGASAIGCSKIVSGAEATKPPGEAPSASRLVGLCQLSLFLTSVVKLNRCFILIAERLSFLSLLSCLPF